MIRKTLSSLILIILLSCSLAHGENRIYFDGFRQIAWLVNDTGILGTSLLREKIIEKGYRPVVSKLPLDILLPELDESDILFLSIVKFGKYSEKEIGAMTDYIARGGNIIVIAEHDNVYKVSSGLVNPFLLRFGMKINFDTVIKDRTDWLQFNVPFFKLENINFYASPSINISGEKTRYLSEDLHIIALYENGGKIIVLGDSEFFLNGNEKFGFYHGNNGKLILRIFEYLAPICNKKRQVNFKNDFKKNIFVYSGINGGFLDKETDGFYTLFSELNKLGYNIRIISEINDIPERSDVIFLNSLRGKDEDIAKILKFNKIIVFGDSYSEIDTYTHSGMILKSLFRQKKPQPFFARILDAAGIRFLSGTYMNLNEFREEETAIREKLENDDIYMNIKRSGVIAVEDTGEIICELRDGFYNPVSLGCDERVPWSKTMEVKFYNRLDTRPENMGKEYYLKNLKIPTKPDSIIPQCRYGIIYEKNNFLCFSDSDMASNYYLKKFPENREIVKIIKNFLVK